MLFWIAIRCFPIDKYFLFCFVEQKIEMEEEIQILTLEFWLQPKLDVNYLINQIKKHHN